MNDQKLIDICFQLVLSVTDKKFNGFLDLTTEEKAAWTARQLRERGFETSPCGASWGVLTK